MNEQDKKVLAAGGLAGIGLLFFLGKAKAQPNQGDTLTLASVGFDYKGDADSLYIGWGLASSEQFDNGNGLLIYSMGYPMTVESENMFNGYMFIPEEDFTIQPTLYLDPDIVTPDTYSLWYWVSLQESTDEASIIEIKFAKDGLIVKEE